MVVVRCLWLCVVAAGCPSLVVRCSLFVIAVWCVLSVAGCSLLVVCCVLVFWCSLMLFVVSWLVVVCCGWLVLFVDMCRVSFVVGVVVVGVRCSSLFVYCVLFVV